MWVYIEDRGNGTFEIKKSDQFPGLGKSAVNGGARADDVYAHAVKQADNSPISSSRQTLESALETAKIAVLAGLKP